MAATIKVANLVVTLSAETDQFTRAFSGVAGQASKTGNTISTAIGTALGNMAVKGVEQIGRVTGAMIDFGKSAVLTAARSQELGLVVQLLGQRAGSTAQEVNQYVQSVVDAGIRTDVAQQLVAQFARRNLDLAQSVDLARVAQDAAVLSMTDSSTALDSIVYGITTYNKRVLRTAGLNVDIQGQFERLADQLGVNVEALSETDKVQAALNGVLEEGANIAGVYELAMEAPGKQLRSLARHIYEVARVAGEPFLDAFGSGVKTVTNFVKSVRSAIDEGGALRPILTNMGAAASIVADKVQALAGAATQAGTAFVTRFGAKLQAAAKNALKWGINISVQLATGLIRGAVSAITAAMRFIGNLLSSWLSPGSPPRVAPDIREWGAATFAEYLRGFADAEFDILEGLQRPLQSALSALVDAGKLAAEESAALFSDLTRELTLAIDEFMRTGVISGEIFDRLRESSEEFGADLAELARRQFALAAATRQVQQAEENLAAARKDEQSAQDDLNRIMDEYNELLGAGASPAVLAAKKKEFLAAKQRLSAAEKETKAAEEQLKTSEERVDPLEEQVRLQERLLSQLVELVSQQEALAEAAGGMGGGGGGGGGGLGAGLGGLGGAAGGLGDMMEGVGMPEIDVGALSETFETAKETIRNALSDLFQPVVDAWEQDVLPSLQTLGSEWERFTGIVKQFWGEKVQPVIDALKEFFPPDFLVTLGEVAGVVLAAAIAFGILSVVVGIIAGILTSTIGILALVAGALALLVTAWEEDWGGIRTTLTDVWENTLLPAFEDVKEWLENTLTAAIEILSTFWTETLLPALQDVWGYLDVTLIPLFEALAELLEVTVGLAVTVLAGLWQNVLLPALETIWGYINDNILPIFEAAIPTAVETAKEALNNLIDNVLGPVKTAFENISSAVQALIGWIQSAIDKLKEVKDKVPDWMKPGSPPPLAIALDDIAAGMRNIAKQAIPELEMAFSGIASPVGLMATGAAMETNYNYSMSVSTRATTPTVVQDFRTLAALAGA